MRSWRSLPAWVTILLLWTCEAAAHTQPETADALRVRATQLIYEHQHDEAIKLLRQAVAIAPDQSATHRSLASAIWLKMLFQRGAVTVDHYLGSFSRARVELAKPSPEMVTEFQKSIMAARTLAESQVAQAAAERSGTLRPRCRARPRRLLHRIDRRTSPRRIPGGEPRLRRA